MIGRQLGLTSVPTEDLKHVLRSLHRGHLEAPLNTAGLAMIGMQDRAPDFLDILANVGHAGVRAVLVAVIAERLEK